jgi:hypothetical protein
VSVTATQVTRRLHLLPITLQLAMCGVESMRRQVADG